MHLRHIAVKMEAALADTPVVLLNGARQTGKSTLVEQLAAHHHPADYYTLDNLATLSAIEKDPESFVDHLQKAVIIDEVQKAPALFPAIKASVDRNRKPGRFLLTGSANILLLPKLSESLAGRMEIITLWPLSQGEISHTDQRKHQQDFRENFIDHVFAEKLNFHLSQKISRDELLDRILLGGYPEVLTRVSADRREAWFESYITAILQRDIREIAHIEGLTVLPRLLSLLATRAAGLLNYAELSRSASIPHTTLMRYLILLETTFLIYPVLPWSSNLGKRLVKSPKLYLNDTGLMCFLLGMNKSRLQSDLHTLGNIFENFVITELKKQLTWNNTRAKLFHYRTQSGQEVDAVLENTAGECVGIEIKLTSAITEKDFKGLKSLAEDLGHKFIRGIVLYTGEHLLPFGKNLYAVPVNALWENGLEH